MNIEQTEEGLIVDGLLYERRICPKCKGTARRGLGPCVDCDQGFIFSVIGKPVPRRAQERLWPKRA